MSLDYIVRFDISKLSIIRHLKDTVSTKQPRFSLLDIVNLLSRRKSLNSLAVTMFYWNSLFILYLGRKNVKRNINTI